MTDEIIAAVATPLGEGALSIIRLSGAGALGVAERCFRPAGRQAPLPTQAPSHTLHYGRIVRDGVVIDEVMLAVLRAPRTFTREDMVEITCHGGAWPTRMVLETLLECGARLAQPGEFTKRAFLNGRLDLAQAEAVADVIRARTDAALMAANEQLAGKLSQRIEALRGDLMRVLAHVEAHIDFPDEDIAPDSKRELMRKLETASEFIGQILRGAREGTILRQGIRAAIVGRPNVGKSSLLNQLLGRERAIVSPLPGTTRDTIEETASIRGFPVVFVDTAGLRESEEPIEREGIRRSRESLARAELVLVVLDRSQKLTTEDELLLEEFESKPQIWALNKSDLAAALSLPEPAGKVCVEISCATGKGIESLKDEIRNQICGGEISAEMLEVMINARHADALRRAREAVSRALLSLRDDTGLEIVAMELRLGTQAVGEIVGKTTTEDLLDSIFSQFCIGK